MSTPKARLLCFASRESWSRWTPSLGMCFDSPWKLLCPLLEFGRGLKETCRRAENFQTQERVRFARCGRVFMQALCRRSTRNLLTGRQPHNFIHFYTLPTNNCYQISNLQTRANSRQALQVESEPFGASSFELPGQGSSTFPNPHVHVISRPYCRMRLTMSAIDKQR